MKRGHLCFLVLLIASWPTDWAHADFKQLIVDRLQANADALVINLPPRPDTWPSAIFTYDMRLPIRRGKSDDPALRRGETTEIEATDAGDVSANASGTIFRLMSAAAEAHDAVRITVAFPDARIVDMEYGELEKRLNESAEAIAAAKRGHIPLMVVKAYEASVTLTLTKKIGASAEAWARVKKTSIEVGAQASADRDDQTTYKTNRPVVFAFETMKADFDADDVSKGVYRLILAKAPAQLFRWRDFAIGREILPVEAEPTGYGPKQPRMHYVVKEKPGKKRKTGKGRKKPTERGQGTYYVIEKPTERGQGTYYVIKKPDVGGKKTYDRHHRYLIVE